MCTEVLVKMSVCPVIMLFMTAHQLHGSIPHCNTVSRYGKKEAGTGEHLILKCIK